MKFRRHFRRNALIGIAALGLAAPAAQARPIEQPSPGPTPTRNQARDLRSPDARDVARQAAIDRNTTIEKQVIASRGQGAPRPVVTSVPAAKVQSAGGGLDLGSIALGAGGFAAIVAAYALFGGALARRGRVQAAR